jgi:hypothetical protein
MIRYIGITSAIGGKEDQQDGTLRPKSQARERVGAEDADQGRDQNRRGGHDRAVQQGAAEVGEGVVSMRREDLLIAVEGDVVRDPVQGHREQVLLLGEARDQHPGERGQEDEAHEPGREVDEHQVSARMRHRYQPIAVSSLRIARM